MKEQLENLKLECETLKNEQEIRRKKIDFLLEDDKVKEYLNLVKKEKEEEKRISNILERMKMERMRDCSHVFVISDVIRENNGKRVSKIGIEYCLKCGLTNKYHLNKMPKQFLTISQENMWKIYKETQHKGKRIKKVCEVAIASEIYDNLKIEMPNVDDEALLPLLEEQIIKYQQERTAKHLNLQK